MDTIKGTFLSNFWECSVEWDGLRYGNAEAAFQAQKCINPSDQRKFVGLTGAEAKALGRRVAIVDCWAEFRWDVMFCIVEAKFRQNPELAEKLIATGDEKIIEGNTWGDTYWGVCNGVGKNNLGKILMMVRGMLKDEMAPKPYNCPECGSITKVTPHFDYCEIDKEEVSV